MSKVGARRRRALATVALVVLIVAVPLGIYAWGRTSSTFGVRHIALSGARPAHTKALRLVLKRRFLGVNLFTVTTGRVRAALSGFPFVARVSVNRDFPDTLRVRMSEYVPAALLASSGRWYVASSEGRVLAVAPASPSALATGKASPSTSASPGAGASPGTGAMSAATQSPAAGATGSGSPSPTGKSSPMTSPSPSSTNLPRPAADVVLPRGTRGLPVIVTAAPLSVGGTVTDPHVRAALTVLAALPAAMRRAVQGASATDTSIRVYVGGGPTFEFGDTTRLTAKVLALKAVLARYHARGVVCTFVDVSVPDRPLGAPLLSGAATQSATSPATSKTPSSPATGAPKNTDTGTPTAAP